MSTWLLLLSFASLALVVVALFIPSWMKWRGTRIVVCPETLHPVAVEVDAVHIAAEEAITGEGRLRLDSCSRWPERADCGQECLRQVEEFPHACLLESIVRTWYAGKSCSICSRAIGPIVWHDLPPALRLDDGTTVEWSAVDPPDIPRLLSSAEPVCWNCHLALSFRHDHGDLVVDRPPHSATPDVFLESRTLAPTPNSVY
jgi:hypothetical protein